MENKSSRSDLGLKEIEKPRVSIITVTYNADKYIEKSLISVINQSYKNLEYIVVDGGSTDQTVNIVDSYCSSVTCLISEPDKGIYDAMNKAIKLSSGEWLFFLGADDILNEDDLIENIFQGDLTPYSLINGDIIWPKQEKLYVSCYNYKLLFKNTINHQGTFYRKSLFDNFSYDIKCKISADYELNLKSFMEKKRLKKVAMVIAKCGENGISKKILFGGYFEEIKIRNKYLLWPLAFVLNFQTLVRFLCKTNIKFLSKFILLF